MDLTIDHVGTAGDGVARAGDRSVYAPFTLPGEIVRETEAGFEVVAASPDRIAPACAHFGACGGCALQHWAAPALLAWKRDQVISALARAGVACDVAPTVDAHGAGRRRAVLHARRRDGALVLGFAARGARTIVPIAACPVLAPPLASALPALRDIAAFFLHGQPGVDLWVTASDVGLDVAVRGFQRGGFQFSADRQAGAAALAERWDIARLSVGHEPLIERRTPVVSIGRAQVRLPPGPFLQATALGEATLAGLVLAASAGRKRAYDLFAGLGVFALRLAETMDVTAVEKERSAIAALKQAVDRTQGLKKIAIETRDLFVNPVGGKALAGFDFVVLDPPRAGAREQAKMLAASAAARIVSVSCDAGTFARDAAILIDGGYRLHSVTPVDQFRWSTHVEIVGVFDR